MLVSRLKILLLPMFAVALSLALTCKVLAIDDSYGGRAMIVYQPSTLPQKGARALVVVLHGGLGNAERIAYKRSESGLNMDSVADKDGFVVAYLNGTPVTRRMGADKLGWNAGGGCCGCPRKMASMTSATSRAPSIILPTSMESTGAASMALGIPMAP